MDKLEINLKIRIPENDLTVNGILQGLEEQTPVILTKILENIFRAIEERIIEKMNKDNPGRYVLNAQSKKAT